MEAVFKRLESYEDILRRAYYENYFRDLCDSHKRELNTLYNSLFGGGSKITHGCSTCVLKDLRRIGEWYFNEKERREKEASTETVETNEEIIPTGGSTINTVNVTEDEVKPKKKGRPKKES